MHKKRLLYILATLFWMYLIFYLSGIPNLKSSYEQDLILRKIAHIFEYFILTFLLFKTLSPFKLNNKKSLIVSAIISIIYAISDEYHQTFIFGREGKFTDVLIDAIGIFLFNLSYLIKKNN